MQNNNTDIITVESCRRRVLIAAVTSIITEAGFHSIDTDALGVLVEMFQSILWEIGRTAKTYCEVAYRTEPVIGDVIMSFADLGLDMEGLHAYAKKNRTQIPYPSQQIDAKPATVLQVGDRKNHLPHISDHFPPFPDTHTYCFTHTYKQPVTEYEAIREKAAQQKKDTERALTRFGTKTHPAENLFLLDDKEFLLIGVKANTRPFHDALMPRDQVFEEDELHLASLIRRRKEEREQGSECKERDREGNETEMENPYLRPVKMPKKRQKKSHMM